MSSPPGSPLASPGWPSILPPFAQTKMDEFFREWLALPETEESIQALVEDAKAGRPLTWKHPYTRPQFKTSPNSRLGNFSLMTPPPRSPGGLSPRSPGLHGVIAGKHVNQHHSGKLRAVRPSHDHVKRKHREVVPLFYFPNGIPQPSKNQEEEEQKIRHVFSKRKDREITESDFASLIEIMGLPPMFRAHLFRRLVRKNHKPLLSEPVFFSWWEEFMRQCDSVVRFFNAVRNPPNNYITADDFKPIMSILLEEQSSLDFLKATPEFQERYAETVIVRIFYKVNKSLTGRLTLRELRNSDLVETFSLLVKEPDVNRITEYFSYEHFYVLYCRFFELDSDHDMLIDKYDLLRYSDHSLTYRLAERIFEGAPRPLSGPDGRMTYHDFIWFCLSEEDKSTDTALQYWFRCVDLDGDGAVSSFEMEYFYSEQLRRMESLGIEAVSFEDVLCQLLDMAKPVNPSCVLLSDLKRSQLGPNFFNILFNLTKFIRQESRDAAAIRNERLKSGMTEWARFARIEYDLLAAAEEADGVLDGDYLNDEEDLSDAEDFGNQLGFSGAMEVMETSTATRRHGGVVGRNLENIFSSEA